MSELREAIRSFIKDPEKVFWGAHHIDKAKAVDMIFTEASGINGWEKEAGVYVLEEAEADRIFEALNKLYNLVGKWVYEPKNLPVAFSATEKKVLINGIAALKEMQQASAAELAFLDQQIEQGIDPTMSELLDISPKDLNQAAEIMKKTKLPGIAAQLSQMPDEQGGIITQQREDRAAKFGDPAREIEGTVGEVIKALEKIVRVIEPKRGKA